MPHLWFRNTWCWRDQPEPEPSIQPGPVVDGAVCLVADDSTSLPLANLPFTYSLGKRYLYGDAAGTLLFTDNESNRERLYGVPNDRQFVKDAFHRAIVDREEGALNSNLVGTKACIDYRYLIPPGGSVVLTLRLTPEPCDAQQSLRRMLPKTSDGYSARLSRDCCGPNRYICSM